jgi:pimeloyl-ACP methyl ester carboxylesterase
MYADTRVRAAYEEGRCVGRLGPGSRAAHQPAAASRHRRFDGRSQPVELKGVGRYERYGQGSPVVILSNPQADPGWWAPPFISAFGGAGYETIPFVHTGDSYAPDAVVRDVAAFVEHLDTEPVRLLGWSQGAAIAQELALLRPDLVAGAALLAAYGRQNSIDRLLQDALAALDAGGSELDPVRQVLLLLTSYPAQLLGDDAFADRLIARARTWAAKPSSNEARRRSVAFIAAYQERLAELARIRVPCLVVGFGLDADTFAARAREVAGAIPGCRYVELADAGHLTPVVDPRSVIDPVLAFFAEVDRGPGQTLPKTH